MAATLVWVSCIAALAVLFGGKHGEQMPEPANPAELKSALIFGMIYALVTLAVGAVKQYVGSAGLYAVAIVSGLTDMNAITSRSPACWPAGVRTAASAAHTWAAG